jgi:hypothetical protein
MHRVARCTAGGQYLSQSASPCRNVAEGHASLSLHSRRPSIFLAVAVCQQDTHQFENSIKTPALQCLQKTYVWWRPIFHPNKDKKVIDTAIKPR